MRRPENRAANYPDFETQSLELQAARARHAQVLERSGAVDVAKAVLLRNYTKRVAQAPRNPENPSYGIRKPSCLDTSESTDVSIRRNRVVYSPGPWQWEAERYTLSLVTPYIDEQGHPAGDVQDVIAAERYNDWIVPYGGEDGFTPEQAQLIVSLATELDEAREAAMPDLAYDLTHISRPQDERPWDANFPAR